jgi:hypothetical protein
MLSLIMLSVIMLNVIMPSVVAPFNADFNNLARLVSNCVVKVASWLIRKLGRQNGQDIQNNGMHN